jgi:hypothetical protein
MNAFVPVSYHRSGLLAAQLSLGLLILLQLNDYRWGPLKIQIRVIGREKEQYREGKGQLGMPLMFKVLHSLLESKLNLKVGVKLACSLISEQKCLASLCITNRVHIRCCN